MVIINYSKLCAKFIGKFHERILSKLSKSEFLRLYSIVHVAMETTKTSKFTRQSKSFISVFFICQVSACQLQPFSCHDLANDISSQTAKTVFSNLNADVVYAQSWRYWPWKTLSSHLNHNICSLVYLFQLRPIVLDDWLIPSSCLHISPLFLKIIDRDHFEESKVPSKVTSRNIPIILLSDK